MPPPQQPPAGEQRHERAARAAAAEEARQRRVVRARDRVREEVRRPARAALLFLRTTSAALSVSLQFEPSREPLTLTARACCCSLLLVAAPAAGAPQREGPLEQRREQPRARLQNFFILLLISYFLHLSAVYMLPLALTSYLLPTYFLLTSSLPPT